MSCSAARSTLYPHALKHADMVDSSTSAGTKARNMASFSTALSPLLRDISSSSESDTAAENVVIKQMNLQPLGKFDLHHFMLHNI